MAQNKTHPTDQTITEFINSLTDEKQKQDTSDLVNIMQEVTGEKPVLWGPSIIGFGKYHYKYDSGREGDNLKVGFSPRKQAFAIYGLNTEDNHKIIEKLGNYKQAKGCIYIKSLSKVDIEILKKMISNGFNNH